MTFQVILWWYLKTRWSRLQSSARAICTITHSTLKRLSELGGSAHLLAKNSELHLMLNARQQRKKRATYRKDLESKNCSPECSRKDAAHLRQNEDRVGCLRLCGSDVPWLAAGWPAFWRAQGEPMASIQKLTELMNKTVIVISLKNLKKSTDNYIDVWH